MVNSLNAAMEDLVLKKTSSSKRYSVFYKGRLLCLGWKRNRTTFSRKSEAKRKLVCALADKLSYTSLISDFESAYINARGYVEEQIQLGNIEIKLMGE